MPVHPMLRGPLSYHGLVVAAGNGRSAPVSLYAYATPQAPPRLRSVPHFNYDLSLDLSDHLKAIEEGLDTDRLRIINSTSLRLWIKGAVQCSPHVRFDGAVPLRKPCLHPTAHRIGTPTEGRTI
jgi:hypothetical protein